MLKDMFFTFSIGCIDMDLFAQTFYESRKKQGDLL